MYLVVVESPTKAKTINKFLGAKYKVASSMGHLIDLPKSQLGVDPDDNFQVKYITIRGKGKTLASLKKLAAKADGVFLATDPDREGEAIAWHLMRAFGIEEDERCRVVFNEITKQAVKDAFVQPRQLNLDLVDAQQARRVLDRLVGYKISPLLWAKVRKGLSAGRVQSAALNMICLRKEEIDQHMPREYWTIEVVFLVNSHQVEAKLSRIDGKKVNLKTEGESRQAVEGIKSANFRLASIEEKQRNKNPQPPFTTSTLQQEAGRKLSFSSRKTMTVAQQLYEGIAVGKRGVTGLITYMRTDSVSVSPGAQQAAREYVSSAFGKQYLPSAPRQYSNRRGAQAAHEAVRPTDVNLNPDEIKQYLSRDQHLLYKLIWQRFVASQMAAARYKQQALTFSGGRYECKASLQHLVFPGFLAIADGSAGSQKQMINAQLQGSETPVDSVAPQQHFTKPPPHYNEALLIKDMEKKGIGRPSTYAPTIDTLLQREYVEKEAGKLLPTELGIVVNDQLKTFFPDIIDVDFTAGLERQLDEIEDGNSKWKMVVAEFYTDFKTAVDNAADHMETQEIAEEETDVDCELCGRKMVVKNGRFGRFLACPGYPECKNTKPFQKTLGVPCPKCQGEIVALRSRKGRVFYGCNRYPDCDFRSWKQPVPTKCPLCGSAMAIENKKSLVCLNDQCGHRVPRDDENE